MHHTLLNRTRLGTVFQVSQPSTFSRLPSTLYNRFDFSIFILVKEISYFRIYTYFSFFRDTFLILKFKCNIF